MTGYTIRAVVILFGLLLAFATGPAAGSDDTPFWPRYVPESERPAIIKTAYKRVKVRDAAVPDAAIDMIWATEPVARVLISHQIDEGRCGDKDTAELMYSIWRDRGEYYVRDSFLPGWPRITGDGHQLKRVDGDDVLSKGWICRGGVLFKGIQVSDRDRSHFIKLHKLSESREPVIRSLDEIVEVSVATESGGYVTARFLVRDLVDKLYDL